ncbi:hypothetical protein QUF64_06465 [Anaerolineales bacterium HSG6]|nr:hypothetical protein [Anaerolineales bacterium HSG6]
MNKGARKFAKKRAIKYLKKLFYQVLEYVTFCYNRLVQDKRTYSEGFCKNSTGYDFESWLKVRFVEDYLQERRKHLSYSAIKDIRFLPEPEKSYTDLKGVVRRDKIDIFITNLNLGSQSYWNNIAEEDIYFAIECKRLKNTSKSSEKSGYLSDVRKFVERKYKFRFPFTGMIGFVEKSSKSIDTIIDDINRRLRESQTITTTQELVPFEVKDFDYCRLSKHKQNFSPNKSIEVYHLFFDYSNIIVA